MRDDRGRLRVNIIPQLSSNFSSRCVRDMCWKSAAARSPLLPRFLHRLKMYLTVQPLRRRAAFFRFASEKMRWRLYLSLLFRIRERVKGSKSWLMRIEITRRVYGYERTNSFLFVVNRCDELSITDDCDRENTHQIDNKSRLVYDKSYTPRHAPPHPKNNGEMKSGVKTDIPQAAIFVAVNIAV